MSDTDFWLYPAGVTNQARAFDLWAEMVQSCEKWVNNHTISSMDQYPAYSDASESARGLRTSVISWLGHLDGVLTGVATELKDVAREGEENDLDEQAKIDATDPQLYEDHGETPYGFSADLVPSDEMYDDIGVVFQPPNGGAGFYCDGGSFDHLNDRTTSMVPGDLLSPTGWIYTVAGWVGATTIGDQVLKAFGGRWGDLREFAYILNGLSTMLEEMRGSLSSSMGAIETSWQGFAANSAQAYFADLLDAIDDAQTAFSDAGEAFDNYCDGVEQAADLIESQLHSLADLIIFAAIAAAAGTVTVETVIGGVVGWGAAGLAIWRAYYLVKETRDTMDDITTLITFLDTIGDLSSDLSDFTSKITIPQMVESN